MNLRLLQLADSALPIGGYCHSWGLEAAIDRGAVNDAPSLERWTRLWLRHALGPLEGVVVASVCRGVSENDFGPTSEANDLLWASLTPPTLRHASRDMGEQLLALAGAWSWATEAIASLQRKNVRGWHHAPVFATLSAIAEAEAEETLAAYLHQATLGILSAGVRAIPIGHTHGQQALARLHDVITELARTLAHRPLESAGNFCPAYEVLCHAQTNLYTRLFRS